MEPFFRALKRASNHAELDLHLSYMTKTMSHTHTYIYILYYIYKYIHMQHTESTHRSPTFHALIARNSESNPSPSEPSETSRELRLRLSHIGGWAQMAARGGRAAGAFTGRRGGL